MILRALCLWLALALPACAQTLPTVPPLPAPSSDTLSDFANLIPPADAARLVAALQAGRAETGVHVVVVTMGTIADYGGAGLRIEDYAKRLFNQWDIGTPALNDGIVILVARDDREVRIALGSGYESIWDNAAQRVIDRHILPAFRNDRYVDGIEAGIAATYDLVARPHAAGNSAPLPEKDDSSLTIILLAVAWGVLAFVLGARERVGDTLFRLSRCPNCGNRGQRRERTVTPDVPGTSQGTALLLTTCRSCQHQTSTPQVIAAPSRDTDGGSPGGFGGGSSSGGGATGRW